MIARHRSATISLNRFIVLLDDRAYLQSSICDHASTNGEDVVSGDHTLWTPVTPSWIKPLPKLIGIGSSLVPEKTKGNLVGGIEWRNVADRLKRSAHPN